MTTLVDRSMCPHSFHGRGSIIPPTQRSAKLVGVFNAFIITSQANKQTVVLNGEVVNEVDLTQGELA